MHGIVNASGMPTSFTGQATHIDTASPQIAQVLAVRCLITEQYGDDLTNISSTGSTILVGDNPIMSLFLVGLYIIN